MKDQQRHKALEIPVAATLWAAMPMAESILRRLCLSANGPHVGFYAIYTPHGEWALFSGFYGISGAATPQERHATVYLPKNPPVQPDNQAIPELDWLPKEDLDFYVEEFKKSGFRGPLNWYRNIDFNWQNTAFLSGSKLLQPTFFVAGELDPVLEMYPGAYDNLEERVPNLWRKVLLPHIGHWVQQEAAAEVNRLLLEFLATLDR
jgi:pimeloyl-ACP methyl ester carboxylesterase